ncbi:unnamed protein product, partial [Clonostachys rosea]
ARPHPVHFDDSMVPSYDWPLGNLMVTASCLTAGSLFTVLASYLRSGNSYSHEWMHLIASSGFFVLHPYELARNGTDVAPLCLAYKSSYVGSIASLYLLRCLFSYLCGELIATAKPNSCEKEDSTRRAYTFGLTFWGAQSVNTLGFFSLVSWVSPSCNPSPLRLGLYVAWVFARVVVIKTSIATFRANFSTGLNTRDRSVIGHAIVLIYACVIAQLSLELGATVFGAPKLVILSMVTMQVGVAVMLLVGNLEVWRRDNRNSLSDEKPHEILEAEEPAQDPKQG